MATKKKMLQAAAGNATGGAGLDIDDVFSTYLYTGNGSTQTITNGIDLDGEGGLVWFKSRPQGNHNLMDTERGNTKYIRSNTTDTEGTNTNYITSFNSNGFTLGPSGTLNGTQDYASWTFRKAPKFFDVVTYTGTGSAGLTIDHSLGSVPGSIIVQRLNSTNAWTVYHRSLGNNKKLELNKTDSIVDIGNSIAWNTTTPTDTQFYLGADGGVNGNGGNYVAYLFAHNDGDGEFGPDSDADVIKCGSYTGNGTVGQEINLGFEPQFVMAKITNTTGTWYIQDAMRGMTGNGSPHLRPNSSDAELNSNGYIEGNIELTPTGFKLDTDDQGGGNGNGDTYIYMAIRRGPLAVPEDATKVFAIDTFGSTGDGKEPSFRTTFPVDMAFYKSTTGTNSINSARLIQNKSLLLNTTSAESSSSWAAYDYQNGYYATDTSTYSTYYSWMWKRAPGYFDVVAYDGDLQQSNVAHNLGVAPEMIWTKCRGNTYDWGVYHKDIGVGAASGSNGTGLKLNTSDGLNAGADSPLYQHPTDTHFQPTGTQNQIFPYIAYLFASAPGVSKVGSYTGDGTTDGSKVIDCGFTSGARFVLIKRTNGGGSWYVWDTARGIVAGNDARLALNSTDAEASFDNVDPHSSGFSVVGSSINNINGGEYIFYAIA